MTKLCTSCNIEQDEKEFNKYPEPNGLNTCRRCKREIKKLIKREAKAKKVETKEYFRKYNIENEEKLKLQARKSWLKRMYNITPEQYDEMLKRQNGTCAICKRPESKFSVKGAVMALAVDHDHAAGTIRGLLCFRCNRFFVGIGNEDNIKLLRESISTMERAIKYIESNITSVSSYIIFIYLYKTIF